MLPLCVEFWNLNRAIVSVDADDSSQYRHGVGESVGVYHQSQFGWKFQELAIDILRCHYQLYEYSVSAGWVTIGGPAGTHVARDENVDLGGEDVGVWVGLQVGFGLEFAYIRETMEDGRKAAEISVFPCTT